MRYRALSIALLALAGCDTSSPPSSSTPDAARDAAALDPLDAVVDSAAPTHDARTPADRGRIDASAPDLGAPDLGAFDAGPPDLGPPDGGLPPGEVPCAHPLDPEPDRPRVALVSFPFSNVVGEHGTTLGAYDITLGGQLVPRAERLDLMSRPVRVRFLPSGRHAVALTEEGVVHSLAVEAAGAPVQVDAIALPGAGWTDLVVDPDGAHVHVTRRDVGAESGVYTVALDCAAGLHPLAAHYGLRLADTLAIFPDDPDRALLIGGQTAFAPFDDDDTRLLVRRPDGGWAEQAAFDLWGDFVDTAGLAIAPDGRDALVPNGSPLSEEGGQVMVVDIDGDQLADRRRIEGMDDARAAWFHHGGTALVTRLEPGRVSILRREDGAYAVIDELRYGLPEDLALVQRGALDGVVVLPAISPATGSQIVTLQVHGDGIIDEIDVLPLPEGGDNIPGSVAVAP